MFGLAYAMGAGDSPAGFQSLAGFVPLILIFCVFYFLLIRPQQKKLKEHKNLINSMQKGDKVVTTGGIHGKITGLTDTIVTLEVAEKIRIKVSRSQITGKSSI